MGFLKSLVMRLLTTAVGVGIVVVGALYALGVFEPEPPVVEPSVQVQVASDYCAQLGGFDDGATNVERLAMAVAHINLAKERSALTCDIFGKFQTLIGPGSTTLLSWTRFTSVVYGLSQVSDASLAKYNQVGLDLQQYLTDPTEWLKEYPWLTCVTHYIRTTWRGFNPWPDHSLPDKMRLVWTSPTGAEFFCPKTKAPP